MSATPRPHNPWRGYLLVLGAATVWGTLGLFYTELNRSFGVPPETIVFFRAGVALLALCTALLIFRHEYLRVQPRHLPLLLGLGTVGIAAFYLVYVYAVQVAGVSVAVVLMYTAPVWVTLYAWRFLGEKLDRFILLALLGALVGAALVAQAYDLARLRLNAAGIVLGLGSGICYACYSILNKYALRYYSPWTALTYGLAFGLPILALFQKANEIRRVLTTPVALGWMVVLGLVPTLAGGLLYAAGLQELPASVGSIIVALEPVIASLLAFVVLGERLAAGQVLGSATILASIVLLGSRDLRGQTNHTHPTPDM